MHLKSHDSGGGGIVHNGPASLLKHFEDLAFHTQPHAVEINGDRLIPIFLGTFGSGDQRASNSGVVEGTIKAAVSVNRRFSQRLYIRSF
jgi:hypothetical protein